MKILSHRGLWRQHEEKNTLSALAQSFSSGFGIETDVRDFCGELTISHDVPLNCELTLHDLLRSLCSIQGHETLPVALNIKSDGLAQLVLQEVSQFPKLDIFVFDMSVPDTRAYNATGIPIYTRMSEVERNPVWLDNASGVWLDLFESDWYEVALVEELLALGKRVCLVSSELHGRAHIPLWEKIALINDHASLMLCTDFPKHARKYFGEE